MATLVVRVETVEGEYREAAGDDSFVVWVETAFTNGACSDGSACDVDGCVLGHDGCCVCGTDILEDWHLVCPDGGDAAHWGCVEVAPGEVWQVFRDREPVSELLPSAKDAHSWLLHHQPQSTDWAIMHEGYEIRKLS